MVTTWLKGPWMGWGVATGVALAWGVSARACKPAPVVAPPPPVAELVEAAHAEGRAEVHEAQAIEHAQAAASIETRIVYLERNAAAVRAEVTRALDSDGGISDDEAASLANRVAGW